ncbi:hypothetical protein M5K25_009879 [Dendrobium thyrsiflorum]|uniref:Uncharacterized protein n=1 Tax=Dendrobium thyrsiflorum TaxID=117978 RepID=A0ABD0V6I6_DENTH
MPVNRKLCKGQAQEEPFINNGPAKPMMHYPQISLAYGCNILQAGAAIPVSPTFFCKPGSISYMVDSRGTTLIPQVMELTGMSSISAINRQLPVVMDVPGAPMGLSGFFPTSSERVQSSPLPPLTLFLKAEDTVTDILISLVANDALLVRLEFKSKDIGADQGDCLEFKSKDIGADQGDWLADCDSSANWDVGEETDVHGDDSIGIYACCSPLGWHIVSLLCPTLTISVQPGEYLRFFRLATPLAIFLIAFGDGLIISESISPRFIPLYFSKRSHPEELEEDVNKLRLNEYMGVRFSAPSRLKAGPEMFLKSVKIQMLEIKENDVLISFPIEVEQWFLQISSSFCEINYIWLKWLNSLQPFPSCEASIPQRICGKGSIVSAVAEHPLLLGTIRV